MNTFQTKVNGFALSEVILVVSIIGLASLLAIPSFTQIVDWSDKKSASVDLIRLNEAVELTRLINDDNSVPAGVHDNEHHERVLRWIQNNQQGPILKNLKKLKVDILKSQGENNDFYFIEYKGEKYKKPKMEPYTQKDRDTAKQSVASNSSSFDSIRQNVWEDGVWSDSSHGIDPQEGNKAVNEVNDFLRRKKTSNANIEKKQYYEMPGNHQWVIPEGVSEVTLELIGGGGSGAHAQMYEKVWGELKPLSPLIQSIGRYGFGGGFNILGSIKLSAPFKLYLTPHKDPFLTSIFAVIGAEKIPLPIGEESIIVRNEEEELNVDFKITSPGDHCMPWYPSRRKRVDSHVFSLSNLYVRHKDTIHYRAGNGGGAGGYSKKTISNLKGGETVFINVGTGGNNAHGGETSARINDVTIKALGGEKGTDSDVGQGGVGVGGDLNNAGPSGSSSIDGGGGGEGYTLGNNGNISMGAGGSGSANPELSDGGSGNCGMAIITYTI